MPLSIEQMQQFATQCAPSVAVETLLSVAKVESGFNPLAIGVNGKPTITVTARSKGDAVAKASALIAAGRSIDLGIGQINSGNLKWLALDVEDAFDPCRNLAASARVLQDGYRRGSLRMEGEQPALRTALSYYNTGHPERGIRNGYVAKVTNAAVTLVPAISAGPAPTADVADTPAPHLAAWDVFGASGVPAAFVIRISSAKPDGDQE